MPVRVGSESRSGTCERAGTVLLVEVRNSVRTAALVNRSVVAAMLWWWSVSSWRVSAIAAPIVFGLIPSSSDSTFWEQIWRQ
jgi:hypothetical protein